MARSNRLGHFLMALGLLTLTGCVNYYPSKPAPTPVVDNCPLPVTYTRQQDKLALLELQKLGPNAILWKYMRDYKTLRNESLTCRGK